MRNIKIYSTVGSSGTITTDVRTLGDLKPLLEQREIDYNGMKLLVGETRNELSVDESILPEGDFKLYLMPQKTKSGNDLDDALEALEAAEEAISEAKTAILEHIGEGNTVSKKSSTSYEDEQALQDLRSLASGGRGISNVDVKKDYWS